MINDIFVWIGIIGEDGRIQMMFNATGTTIAMTHILLPFMILPLYSVMKTISPSYVRAARSLGATQLTAFTRVYFPQTLPGLGALVRSWFSSSPSGSTSHRRSSADRTVR